MRYKVQRITPGSALRVGCALGWLVSLCPAVCLAGLAVRALQQVDQAFGRITPIDISLFGQQIAQLDLLNILGLSAAAQTVGGLTSRLPVTFALLVALLVVAGALVIIGALLLFSVGYNLLAALGGGLEVELESPAARDG